MFKKRMKPIILSLTLLLILIVSLSVVSAADMNVTSDNGLKEANITSNTPVQSNITDTNTGTYTDLHNLIDTSTGSVNLSKDYKYDPTVDTNYTNNGINIINKTITINGNGYSIDGNNQNGILNLFNSSVVFNDLTFKNTNTITNGSNGGSLYINSSNVIINNCNFINSNMTNYGGGIYAQYSNLNITNSNFTSNIAYVGGAIATYQCNLFIENCLFNDNYANYAGAIYSESSNVTINSSSFKNNKGNESSGGIREADSNLNIYNSEFINNTGSMGAISLTNHDNGTYNIVMNNLKFQDNIGTDISGAIRANCINTMIKITNSIFTNNTSDNVGGISAELYNSTLELDNTTFNSNYDGAIWMSSGNLILNNSILTDNIASTVAGAVGADKNVSVKIINSIINNNQAEYGGGIFTGTNNKLNITNSTITNNKAEYGGGIYNDYNNTIIIDNTLINGNTANVTGAGIYNFMLNKMKINSSTINNNIANSSGAGIFNNISNILWIINTELNNNMANGSGGGIELFNNNTNLIESSTIENNTALNGGGLNGYYNNNILLYSTKFIENNAVYGGGVGIGFNSLANIVDCSFINNTAINGNGVNAYNNNSIKIKNSTFINSQVKQESGDLMMNNNVIIDSNASAVDLGNVSADLDYNWWGSNNNPNNLIVNRNMSDVNLTKWVIMTFTANTTNTSLGNMVHVIASLNTYTDGNNTYNMTSLIPDRPVLFNTSSNSTYNIDTKKDTISMLYFKSDSGNSSLSSTIDNQTLTLDVTFNPLTNKTTILTTPYYNMTYSLNNTYNGTLYDSYGNPVRNHNVTLTLIRTSTNSQKQYNVTTNRYGVYSLPITLSPGYYQIMGFSQGDTDYESSYDINAFEITNSTITADNINVTYKTKINFTGYLKGLNNKPLGNETIGIEIQRLSDGASKFYYLTTDSNGKFSLPINFNPGTYIVRSMNNDNHYTFKENTITITNGTIDNRNITYVLMDNLPHAISYNLVDAGNDQPISNATVTFEFTRLSNGLSKNYTYTTNDEGKVAIFLGLGNGDYKVKEIYNGTSIYQPCIQEATFTINNNKG